MRIGSVSQSLSSALFPSHTKKGEFTTIPYAVFENFILKYLESPADDLSLRLTCKYLKNLFPMQVNLSLVVPTQIRRIRTCIEKYQKGIFYSVKVNQEPSGFALQLPFSLKVLDVLNGLIAPHELLSLEELRIHSSENGFIALTNFLLACKLETLRSLCFMNLCIVRDCTLICRLAESKRLPSTLKKLKLAFEPLGLCHLNEHATKTILDLLPQWLDSSLEELDITLPSAKETDAENPDPRFLEADILNKITNSTVLFKLNGRILLTTKSAQNNQPVSPTPNNDRLIDESLINNCPTTTPPSTSTISSTTLNDEAINPVTRQSSRGIAYCLREFCSAIGRLFASFIEWLRGLCN